MNAREKCGRLSFNQGEKNLYSFPALPARIFVCLFFFLEFPQPPGGMMTRRTVFTRQIITVESVFARSDWLLYPWYPVLFTSERRQNRVSKMASQFAAVINFTKYERSCSQRGPRNKVTFFFVCKRNLSPNLVPSKTEWDLCTRLLKSCVTLFSWHVHRQVQKVS